MHALKSIKQRYSPEPNLLNMMNTFRKMVNYCIRTGLEHNKTSMKSLSLLCYPMLKEYEIDSRYKLCAISRAAGILRNYRKLKRRHEVRKQPYCTRPVLITCYGLKIKDGYLHMPSKIKIPLNKHTLQVLSDPTIEMRSVTINDESLNIAIMKNVEPMECTGIVGLDRNLDNVTMVDTEGNNTEYDIMRKATEIKAKCKQVKSRFIRNDVSIRRILFKKYGGLEKNRVLWIIHNVSKKIIEHARQNRMMIAMEDIKGIRKLYRKGNYQGRRYRAKMNSWSYYELQRQIQYKAAWEGVPIIYVSPWGTSSKCSRCGDRMFTEENRVLRCASCDLCIDRDLNAARNILAKACEKRALRFRAVGLPDEAMMVERSQQELIHRVDGSQSRHQTKT